MTRRQATPRPAVQRVHATAVALRIGRRWRAVLLRGPSGAGKSDLALRLIDDGARLVADDQTELGRRLAQVVARCPPTIAGLLEVRGLGIIALSPSQRLAEAPLSLLVDLVDPRQVERMPEPAHEDLLGCRLPVLALAPFEASAPQKLRLALRRVGDP
ncbi:MAG: aldolase [Reyranellaceae bacterium]